LLPILGRIPPKMSIQNYVKENYAKNKFD